MPFGLRNAPATIQRHMDQFRNGLPNVNILVYLDDIVVLSETFEQYIEDLRMVFDRLKKFKLCANRIYLVWVKLHPLSKASQNRRSKLMPRRDGPYIVLSQRSPTTFVVASCDKPGELLGAYHTSALTPFLNGTETTHSPVVPLKKRGRPRKQPLIPRGTAGENAIMSASTPPRRDGLRRCRGRM
ncbi:retrovirus-related Pol polyprotein from transposon 412 [Trichonephila clavipes]|nr:retrovirus-related Pol polyprotein from transposon 412 [Trichonephila clavipes]